MLTLAFDTATDKLTVALGTNEEILVEINLMAPREHMERLLPAIEQIMEESKLKLADIDGIAVGIGPGSFTGVRIGVSTARGLAQGLNKKIIGVPTPDCLAHGLSWEGVINCLVDAKRGEVYSTLYDSSGEKIERLTDHEILSPERVCGELAKLDSKIILTGDALAPYGDLFRDKLGSQVEVADEEHWYPKASNTIELALKKLASGNGDLHAVEPIYVRLSQAEESFAAREDRGGVLISLDWMGLENLGDILKIEKRLFPSPWNRWMFKAEIESERSFCLVARFKKKIVGYGILNFFEGEAHVMNVAVVPVYQNLGIGSVLIARLIELAVPRGVRRLTLEVRPSNVSARRLYQKFGFQEIGVRKNYYADTNEDGLILWTGDITFESFQERLLKIEADVKRELQVVDRTGNSQS